ncbi:2Fe-2S ferredoxin [Erwinia sp. OLTSP20]|uniref:class I ribonucleotide reductase maintenance protein YfaE n=1 Tax=unclassified Erwinia TaxID=2622719 RepID=UPI000C18A433|nr:MULTISPECIES: class I ribonucleotide reductase maintenance protein YfaE [unclassified Erwinia]PIJ50107.1 2Fe-2S ferredoxin [Erwinia sp. OAMSP11]PIJ71975.1 2Fe-2S ferredoxin [Erwinia sp. OLSSP12]PIJ80957.1 2Fe-2S ferredoxin [Erwinia sp. OLCASP19]PIJ83862.1 2Fe-2S ferredoxin [Erwinia sp. OLMTSP26]PIJ86020.1 2Fe-2S ferredoxin [Erwinia sp. OLMDSP33]
MAHSTITLRSTGTRIDCKEQHDSLLDALESHQVCVEYQCREGYCGACRTRLLKGEVCYASQPLAAIQQGEILPCCCQAKGDIEIDM